MSTDLLALPEGYFYRAGDIKLEFIEVLGGGGFGVVYRAFDANRNVEVAVKEYIPKQFAARSRSNGVEVVPKTTEDKRIVDWGLQHFIKESVKLLMFNHPGIVKVLARYEANRTAYIVMELVDGVTISDYVRQNGPVGLDRMPEMLTPLCSAIDYLHKRKYIHRDIKPSNIMLRDGVFSQPVLIDFGAARLTNSVNTRDLRQIWSEGYSAPELAEADPPSEASDVYSLGAVAYFTATGKRPASSIQQAKPTASVRPLASNPSTKVEQVIEAVDGALEPLLSKRVPSVSHFVALMDGQAPPQAASAKPMKRPKSGPSSSPSVPSRGSTPRAPASRSGGLLVPAALSIAALLLVVLALLVVFGGDFLT